MKPLEDLPSGFSIEAKRIIQEIRNVGISHGKTEMNRMFDCLRSDLDACIEALKLWAKFCHVPFNHDGEFEAQEAADAMDKLPEHIKARLLE